MLINNVSSMANRIQYDFENVSSKVIHRGVMGSLREDILRKCLRDLIPSKFSIGTGIVLDAHDTQSKQQDFLIFDGFSSPQFLKNEVAIFLPVESVYATIEVKSTLRTKDLRQAIENACSVKSLEKNIFYPPYPHVMPSNVIFSSIFAYSSEADLDTIHRKFDEINLSIPLENRISTICILDKGCIVHADKKNLNTSIIWPNETTITINRKNTLEQNLYLFYLTMQYHLSITVNYPPDLLKYANINKSLNNKNIGLHVDSLSAGEEVWIGNVKLSGDDVIRYQKILPFINQELTEDVVKKSGLTREALVGDIAWAMTWINELDVQLQVQNNQENKGNSNP